VATKRKANKGALQKELEAIEKAIQKLGTAEVPQERELLAAIQAVMPLPLYEDHEDAFFDLLSEVIEPFKQHAGGLSFQLPWDTQPVDPPKPQDPEWRRKMAAALRKLAVMSRKLAADV
jgi:hypothetical protein